MLRKIMMLIGSLVCSGLVLAEDAPLPFDDPAAAPPIVRKSTPTKLSTSPWTSSAQTKAPSKHSAKKSKASKKHQSTAAAKKPAYRSAANKGNKVSKAAGSAKKPKSASVKAGSKNKSSSKSRK